MSRETVSKEIYFPKVIDSTYYNIYYSEPNREWFYTAESIEPKKIKSVYMIGSLRNDYIRDLELKLNKEVPQLETFLEWHGAGKFADDEFKAYHKGRGLSYRQALQTAAARHIYEFDKYHLDRTDGAILILPAGRSCMLEAGYTVGKGKPLFIFFAEGEPEERWDIMLQFGTNISYTEEELIEELKKIA